MVLLQEGTVGKARGRSCKVMNFMNWRRTSECLRTRGTHRGRRWKKGSASETHVCSDLIPWAYHSILSVFLCLDAQSLLTLCDPMDCSPRGSSVQEILLTQGSNLGLPHSRWIIYHLNIPSCLHITPKTHQLDRTGFYLFAKFYWFIYWFVCITKVPITTWNHVVSLLLHLCLSFHLEVGFMRGRTCSVLSLGHTQILILNEWINWNTRYMQPVFRCCKSLLLLGKPKSMWHLMWLLFIGDHRKSHFSKLSGCLSVRINELSSSWCIWTWCCLR